MLTKLLISGCSLLFLSGYAQAHGEAISYDELVKALLAGESTTAIIDFSHCSGSGTPAGATKGGLRIESFLMPGGKFLAFSDTHATLNKDGAPITEYLKYRVVPDGTVELRHSTYDSKGAPVGATDEYSCKINDGVHFVW